MDFRLGEVGAHELGHGQDFESDGATWNFIKDLGGTRYGLGNLIGEGQGIPWGNPSSLIEAKTKFKEQFVRSTR